MVRCNCRLAVVNTLGPKTPRVNGRERERERWSLSARERTRGSIERTREVREGGREGETERDRERQRERETERYKTCGQVIQIYKTSIAIMIRFRNRIFK